MKRLIPLFLLIALAVSSSQVSAHTASAPNPNPKGLSAVMQINQTLRNKATAKSGQSSYAAKAEVEQQLTVRKQLMLELAKSNPGLFLAQVLPTSVKSGLSVNALAKIESPKTISGVLGVMHIDDFKNPENSRFAYYVHQGKTKIELFPTKPLNTASGARVTVSGYQLDSFIVADTAKNIKIIPKTNTVIESVGPQRTLFIPLKDGSVQQSLPTKEQISQMAFSGSFQSFMAENSYGKVSFTGTVLDWLQVSTAIINSDNCSKLDVQEVENYLKSQGVNVADYGRIVFLLEGVVGGCSDVGKRPSSNFSGQEFYVSVASVGMGGYNGSYSNHPFSWTHFDYVLAHEIGHSLGVYHANGWDCGAQAILGSCEHIEYGNYFDTMGYGVLSLHFNSFYKKLLGWLDADSANIVSQSGTYELNPLEKKGKTLLEIKNPAFNYSSFALEYRDNIGFDAKLSAGQNLFGLFTSRIKEGITTQLIDTVPTSAEWFNDLSLATLKTGSRLVDLGSGITVGPVKSADKSKIVFDVQVTQPQCVKLLPEVKILGDNRNISVAGVAYGFILKIADNDSDLCPSAQFKVDAVVPLGWKVNIHGGAEFTGEPSSINYKNIEVIIPANAVVGDYPLTFIVDRIDTSEQLRLQQTIKIVEPAAITSVQPNTVTAGTVFTATLSQVSQSWPDNAYGFLVDSSNEGRFATFIGKYKADGSTNYSFTLPSMMTVCTNSCKDEPWADGQYNFRIGSMFGADSTNAVPLVVGNNNVSSIAVVSSTSPAMRQNDSYRLEWTDSLAAPNSKYNIVLRGETGGQWPIRWGLAATSTSEAKKQFDWTVGDVQAGDRPFSIPGKYFLTVCHDYQAKCAYSNTFTITMEPGKPEPIAHIKVSSGPGLGQIQKTTPGKEIIMARLPVELLSGNVTINQITVGADNGDLLSNIRVLDGKTLLGTASTLSKTGPYSPSVRWEAININPMVLNAENKSKSIEIWADIKEPPKTKDIRAGIIDFGYTDDKTATLEYTKVDGTYLGAGKTLRMLVPVIGPNATLQTSAVLESFRTILNLIAQKLK